MAQLTLTKLAASISLRFGISSSSVCVSEVNGNASYSTEMPETANLKHKN